MMNEVYLKILKQWFSTDYLIIAADEFSRIGFENVLKMYLKLCEVGFMTNDLFGTNNLKKLQQQNVSAFNNHRLGGDHINNRGG